jgi:hypothetical protein
VGNAHLLATGQAVLDAEAPRKDFREACDPDSYPQVPKRVFREWCGVGYGKAFDLVSASSRSAAEDLFGVGEEQYEAVRAEEKVRMEERQEEAAAARREKAERRKEEAAQAERSRSGKDERTRRAEADRQEQLGREAAFAKAAAEREKERREAARADLERRELGAEASRAAARAERARAGAVLHGGGGIYCLEDFGGSRRLELDEAEDAFVDAGKPVRLFRLDGARISAWAELAALAAESPTERVELLCSPPLLQGDAGGSAFVWPLKARGERHTVGAGVIPPVVPGLPVELVSLSGDARPRVFAIENFISDDEIDALLAQAKDRLQAAKTLE